MKSQCGLNENYLLLGTVRNIKLHVDKVETSEPRIDLPEIVEGRSSSLQDVPHTQNPCHIGAGVSPPKLDQPYSDPMLWHDLSVEHTCAQIISLTL